MRWAPERAHQHRISIAARSVTVRHGAPLPYWQEDSAAQRTTRQHRPALLRCLKPVVVLESS